MRAYTTLPNITLDLYQGSKKLERHYPLLRRKLRCTQEPDYRERIKWSFHVSFSLKISLNDFTDLTLGMRSTPMRSTPIPEIVDLIIHKRYIRKITLVNRDDNCDIISAFDCRCFITVSTKRRHEHSKLVGSQN